MAYINSNNQSDNQQQGTSSPDNQPNNNTQQNNQNTGVNVSGSASGDSQGGAAPKQASATPSATKSGSFTNLQSYLNANAGYNNGQGLAGKTYDTLQNQEQTQQQNLNQGYDTFQNQANQSRIQYDPNAVNSALSNPSQYLYGSPNDTTNVNQSNLSNFQNMLNGNYKAPTFDNTGTLQNNISNFQGTLQNTGTEPGRYALLQQLYGNPTYNTGEQSLDNLLLQSNPQQLQKLQSAQGLGSQLSNAYQNLNGQAQNLNNQYSQEAQQTNQQTQTALTGAISSDQQALQDKLSNLQNTRNQDYQNMISKLQQGRLTPDQMQQYGINNGEVYYNVDPTKFLAQNNQSLGVNNVATDQDNATFKALAALSGNAALSNYAAPSSAPISPAYQFNNVGFQNAVKDAQNAYNTAAANTKVNIGTGVGNTGVTGSMSINQLQSLVNAINSNQNHVYSPTQAAAFQKQIDEFNNKYGLNHTFNTLNGNEVITPTKQSKTNTSPNLNQGLFANLSG